MGNTQEKNRALKTTQGANFQEQVQCQDSQTSLSLWTYERRTLLILTQRHRNSQEKNGKTNKQTNSHYTASSACQAQWYKVFTHINLWNLPKRQTHFTAEQTYSFCKHQVSTNCQCLSQQGTHYNSLWQCARTCGQVQWAGMYYSDGYPAQCLFWCLCNLPTWSITPWLLPYFLSVRVSDLSPETLAVQLCTSMMYTVVSTFHSTHIAWVLVSQGGCLVKS